MRPRGIPGIMARNEQELTEGEGNPGIGQGCQDTRPQAGGSDVDFAYNPFFEEEQGRDP